jgi:ferric-dicitrate binding protein FerR (iron transport regulator)
MNKVLLKKYFDNRCTDEELDSVLNWFENAGSTSAGKEFLFGVWEKLPDETEKSEMDFDLILDKIHHRVNLMKSREHSKLAGPNISKYKGGENLLRIFTRVAAVLLLPVLGFAMLMSYKYQSVKSVQNSAQMSYNEVFSSVDAITKITLPDGSNVWLNHSSVLKYPSIFQGKTRNVELKGEGYFEVAHNEKIPFIVKTGDLQVVALGTKFNLLAYPDEDKIETSLINGCVKLLKSESDGKIATLLKMKPTDLAIYQKSDNEIFTRTISDDRYFSWKDGKLVFNKEPMGEVVRKLRRWFNVDIQIKDPELLELTFTGTFRNETLPQVMELFAMVSPIDYTISKRSESIDGTFSKRQVVLSYGKCKARKLLNK